MISYTIETPVNKETAYRWPLNRLCYQAAIPDPKHRCCFPQAAVLCSSAFYHGNLSYLLQLNFNFLKPMCFLPFTPALFPRYYHFHSLLFGKAGCGACHPLCVLCLCASSHPEELQSGTRALCLTAGMFCIY